MIEKKSLSRFSFVLPLLPDPVLHSYAMHIFFEGWGAGDGGKGRRKVEGIVQFLLKLYIRYDYI